MNTPILYVKTGCPYCARVMTFLDEHGVSYTQKNVTDDEAAFAEMKSKSGQDKAPTLDWYGKILSDFDVDELKPFLQELEVKLEDN